MQQVSALDAAIIIYCMYFRFPRSADPVANRLTGNCDNCIITTFILPTPMMKKNIAITLFILLMIASGRFLSNADAAATPVATNFNGKVTYNILNTKSSHFSAIAPNENSDYIEDNYPQSIWHGGGNYWGGAFIDVSVANFENDLYSEIIISSLAAGPLNVFNHNGSIRPGFPIASGGVSYSASIDNYIVSAVGDSLNLYDGSGNLLWGVETQSSMTAPPIMYKEGGEVYVVYNDSYRTVVVDSDGNALPGWPVPTFPNIHAAADLDGDDEHEIIVVSADGTGHNNMRIYRKDGSLYSSTATFTSPHRAHPSIGDVDGDGELEIVIVGREYTPPSHIKLHIFNHDGSLQDSLDINDTISTGGGAQAALADIDADGTPEILFLGDDYAHVIDSQGNYMPGWPKVHSPSPLYPNGSNIVVADVVSDGDREYPEIVYTLRSGTANSGAVKIFNHDGTEVPRWDGSELYPIASGRSNAVADIDGDGFNEIIIAGSYWDGIAGYYPALWAIDLNKHQRPVDHGGIHWGGYGNDSGKSGLYISPTSESLR